MGGGKKMIVIREKSQEPQMTIPKFYRDYEEKIMPMIDRLMLLVPDVEFPETIQPEDIEWGKKYTQIFRGCPLWVDQSCRDFFAKRGRRYDLCSPKNELIGWFEDYLHDNDPELPVKRQIDKVIERIRRIRI